MPVSPASKVYRTWMADSRRWDSYRPRAGDIIVATYPKCGTTWMQQIVSLLIFQTPEPQDISRLMPWIDRRVGPPVDALWSALDAQPHRRSLKSHLPFDGLPISEEVRYIHVARDARDAVLSYHHQIRRLKPHVVAQLDRIGLEDETLRQPYPRIPAEPSNYFHLWLTSGVGGAADGTPFLSYFDTERTYWRERKRTNLLMVHYRDLKSDLAGEIRRIARFLEIEVRESIFADLVKAATFEEMRRMGDRLVPRVLESFEGGADQFFHKGQNERWRGVLREDDLSLYERKLKATVSPACATWLERGRLDGVDPREASD